MRISDWSSDVCSSDLREAAGVAHEDGGGGRVEPQEGEAGADDRGGEQRQLTRAGDVRDAEIAREFRVARAIDDEEEGQAGEDHREGREPAEPAGEVDGVAEAEERDRNSGAWGKRGS